MLIDFPYCYELDGNKLYCSAPNDKSPTGRCDGVIDYDDGFNFLKCSKCGVRYRVNELAKSIKDENIIIKGRRKRKMEVYAIRNGVTIKKEEDATKNILKPEASKIEKSTTVNKPVGKLQVSVNRKPVQPKKNNNPKKNNSDYRYNNQNNRGIVRANRPCDSTLEVTANKKSKYNNENSNPIVKYTTEQIKSGDYKFSSYDNENNLMIFENSKIEGISIAINVSSIPREELDKLTNTAFLNDELESAKSDLLTIEEKYEELLQANNHLVAELESVVNSRLLVEEKYEDSEKRYIDLLNNFNELEEKLNNLSATDDSVEINKNIEDLNKAIENLTDELNKSIEEKEELYRHIAKVNKSNTELTVKNTELSNNLEQLRGEYEALEENFRIVESREKENDSIKEELDKLRTQFDAVNNILSVANEKLDSSLLLSDEETNFEKYNENHPELQMIYGKLTTISAMLGEELNDDKNIIVFPDSEGDYCRDQNGLIISVVAINGKTISDLGNNCIESIVDEEIDNSEKILNEESDETEE